MSVWSSPGSLLSPSALKGVSALRRIGSTSTGGSTCSVRAVSVQTLDTLLSYPALPRTDAILYGMQMVSYGMQMVSTLGGPFICPTPPSGVQSAQALRIKRAPAPSAPSGPPPSCKQSLSGWGVRTTQSIPIVNKSRCPTASRCLPRKGARLTTTAARPQF